MRMGLMKRSYNTTTLEQTKVKLIFCVLMECEGEPKNCYCCMNKKPKPLFYDT